MSKKILVIEDEPIILLSILNLLERNGYLALSADNGEIGIQLARQENPDLIICNMAMPRVTGYEVIRELRNYPNTTMIPFIVITAQGTPVEIEQWQELGVNNYLLKPYNSDELLRKIGEILNQG
jgi:CheY-like chemotaxis protein